jgi:hypothetical protein
MRFRKLRIAWSALWCLAFVLLTMLRVRSNTHRDEAAAPFGSNRRVVIQSLYGEIECLFTVASWYPISEWRLRSESTSITIPPTLYLEDKTTIHITGYGFSWAFSAGEYLAVGVPHWFAMIGAIALAIAPWVRWPWRFNLRTLLIGTTLVALVLGTVMYFSARPPATPRFDQGFGR